LILKTKKSGNISKAIGRILLVKRRLKKEIHITITHILRKMRTIVKMKRKENLIKRMKGPKWFHSKEK